ncbi:tetratricopeptide repeat protein [Pararobbsia alpina]|uniref:Beta-barrel assembly-enhancing protease n=1 Tax=Pararobbsia alpina TaxID=621374 RepID=A0A6S7BAZ6_9BURK|nr:tetratricopeptide repeat protein [Pararobbsia alpina]CAB3792073.1 Beta-barrel assembly-enhancing protease [Pararobbsia alpina]
MHTPFAADPAPSRAILQEAIGLHMKGQFEGAAALYEKLLEREPRNPDILQLLGICVLARGQADRAVELLGLSIELDPDQPPAHANLGRALKELGRGDEAIASFDRAIVAAPGYVDAWIDRGNTLSALGRINESLASFDAALSADPGHVGALNNRSAALRELKRYDEALACLHRAIEIEPDNVDTLLNLSTALRNVGNDEESIACVDRILARDPQHAPALNNRANALANLRRYQEALPTLDQAIAIAPGLASAWVNRGNVLAALCRHDDAHASFQHALAIAPDSAATRWNASLLALLLGHFPSGWQMYESRWAMPSFEPRRHTHLPFWLGDADLRNKRVVLWHEQGLGDTLQFCRYAIMVAALGAAVVLEVPPALKTLLAQSLRGIAMVVATGEPIAPCDFATPLMSLPFVFGTQADTIPFAPAYLKADPHSVATWAQRLGPRRRKLRIGVTFSGNAAHKNDRERSLPADQFVSLCNDAEWFIIQKGMRDAGELAYSRLPHVHYVGDELADFSDTAALMTHLDLVISADTAVAHLAGALGRPVWVLLPANPDWRWQRERTDSPWYPTASLFRQQRAGDWGDVVQQVVRALLTLAYPRR